MDKKIYLIAKIILIILIILTSIGAAILIGFNWNNFFNREFKDLYEEDEKIIGSYAFLMGVFWLFMDSIWGILFFILYKISKKKE